MKKNILLSTITAGILVASFTGCGGGGGGSSSTLLDSSFTNAVVAPATIENAEAVEETVVSTDASQFSSLLSVSNENSVPNLSGTVASISKTTAKFINYSTLNNYSLNETINESQSCSYSGTVSYIGSGDESGGTLTLTFNNCKETSSETMNGSIKAVISNYNSSADNFSTINMSIPSDLTMTYSSTTESIKAGSYFNMNVTSFDYSGYPEIYNIATTIVSTIGSDSYGVKDAKFYYDISGSDASMYITQGRFYANNLGIYVDYDTNYDMSATPFVYSSYGTFDNGGEARFTMTDAGQMKIVIESNTPISYVDSDGDGIYELVESLK